MAGDDVYIKPYLPCPIASIGKVVCVSGFKAVVQNSVDRTLDEYNLFDLLPKEDLAEYSKDKLRVKARINKFDEDVDLFLKEVRDLLKNHDIDL